MVQSERLVLKFVINHHKSTFTKPLNIDTTSNISFGVVASLPTRKSCYTISRLEKDLNTTCILTKKGDSDNVQYAKRGGLSRSIHQ